MDADGSDDQQNAPAHPDTGMFHGTGHGEYSRADVTFDQMS